MTRHSTILITLLVISVLVVGCSSVKAEPAEFAVAKLAPAEPNKIEPNQADPNNFKPPEPQPLASESPKIEPNEVDSSQKKAASFHDKCAGILKTFVDDKGMVDYKLLKRKKTELPEILNEFARLNPGEYNTWPKEDKIAFWINAYNMEMLNIIVQNYPIESSRILRVLWGSNSVRNIDKNIGGISRQKFIVMNEEFTLAEIEERLFRKEFGEPRAFLATSQDTLSSPLLRNEPYCGIRLDSQLGEQARKFLAGPRAFNIDRKDKVVYLSAIFQSNWHGQDFVSRYGTDKKFKDREPAEQAVLNFITKYISEQDVSFLELENYSIQYITYDWTLNDSSIR